MEVAVSAAQWVVGKALAPVMDSLLEAWAASAGLGPNIDALKMELLYVQGMLDNAQDRDVRSPALKELLHKLRQLAYDADDVLDELDYFRIQDALDGTYHAANVHTGGCAHGLVLNARHTARSSTSKLKIFACSRDASRADLDGQEDDAKQGCLSAVRSCGGREISSTPPPPANEGDKEVDGGCMTKVASSARSAVHYIGKHFPCYSFRSVHDDAHPSMLESSSNMAGSGRRFLCSAWTSKAQQRNHVVQTPKLKFNRVEMSRKIKDIVEQLKPVCAKVSTILDKELLGSAILKLELLGSNRTTTQDIAMKRPQTTPAIIEPKLFGRDSQKKSIADSITHGEYCANALTVLPIVGPGGMGKTTFTQHLYKEVKSHFQAPIWICVSLNFNANRLAQDIVKKIPEVNGENKNWSEEEKIAQRLQSKRFLLVLDDMWTCNEDEWRKLLAPFKKTGTKGNMVIVTTRIPEVAKMVRTVDHLNLERLRPEDIMCFFEVCVFGDQQPWKDHEILREVGREIVDRLKGFPLAAKTVGRLLRNNLTLDHWTRVLDSKEWEFQTSDDDIMPALKLSYDYLPFHLKQCFSYCALFPEDYEFNSEELIHLWIGLGLVDTSGQNKRIEDVGLSYLNDLGNHGFFKMEEKANGSHYYVIHDLLHELATKVSSYECLSIYSSNVRSIQIPPSIRHLSIIIDERYVNDKMIFEDYKRDLSALDKRIKVENLRTLKLLQELTIFVVRKESKGFELQQIGQLEELGGSLGIYNLENVEGKEEADEARLMHKKHLHKLILEWDINRSTKDPAREEHVLESLVPHSNLQGLRIRGHGGTNCPTWLGANLSVKSLESLYLDDVSWKNLPPLGELWLVNEHGEECQGCISGPTFLNLKRLELVKIPRLKKWVGNGTSHLFSHLEALIIRDCSELLELPFSHSTCCQSEQEANMSWFPTLRELEIVDCPKLMPLPPIPWTRAPCSANIARAGSGFEELAYSTEDISEFSLEIKGKDGQDSMFWKVLDFYNLAELKELKMEKCPPIPRDHLQMLSSLMTLKICDSCIVLSPVEGERSHVGCTLPVDSIEIERWGGGGKELTQLLSHFPKLTKLTAYDCQKITGMGVVEQRQMTATPASSPPSSANKIVEHHQQTRGEEEIAAAGVGGLLLLPPQLQELEIDGSPELSLRTNSLDDDTAGGTGGGGGGLQGLHSLRSLIIGDCPKLLSSYLSSSSGFPFPTSLEGLYLTRVGGMGTLAPLSNLTSLARLLLRNCGDLRGEGLWPLLAQGHLTELFVYETPKLFVGAEATRPHDQEIIRLSSKLQKLWTDDVAGVLAAPICSLLSSSLTELAFCENKEVERFTKEQEGALHLLTSLQELRFIGCNKLQCLPAGLHRLPSSLQELDVSSHPFADVSSHPFAAQGRPPEFTARIRDQVLSSHPFAAQGRLPAFSASIRCPWLRQRGAKKAVPQVNRNHPNNQSLTYPRALL